MTDAVRAGMVAHKRTPCAYAVVDRCGNNWRNGKGGCGLLVQTECCNTVATAFNALMFLCSTRNLPGGRTGENCRWR